MNDHEISKAATYIFGTPVEIPAEMRQDHELSVEHAAEALGIQLQNPQLSLLPRVEVMPSRQDQERIREYIGDILALKQIDAGQQG